MPPKREKKGKETDKQKSDSKDAQKSKKKVLAKGEGMGGTIGIIEKPMKKCLTTVKAVSCPPPPSCPPLPICCPPVTCCQQICHSPPSNCSRRC